MDPEELGKRLSRISTRWSLILQAHAGSSSDAVAAQNQLLQRYGSVVYRYLLGAVRDPDVAEELSQEFAYRFVRGDFRRATPERGRFRDYLRTALIHLLTDFHRARQAWPQRFPPETELAAPAQADGEAEHDFLQHWRTELLDHTWQALARANAPFDAVLRLRIENPDLTSAQMAVLLGSSLGKTVDGAWVRKTLQRAHAKFADLLLNEVRSAQDTCTEEELQEELKSLDLLRYCHEALARRASRTGREESPPARQGTGP